MDGAARSAAARVVAATARDDLMYGERLKLQLAALQDEFPGWQIWYVLLYPVGARWCARPGGCRAAGRLCTPTVRRNSPW